MDEEDIYEALKDVLQESREAWLAYEKEPNNDEARDRWVNTSLSSQEMILLYDILDHIEAY